MTNINTYEYYNFFKLKIFLTPNVFEEKNLSYLILTETFTEVGYFEMFYLQKN